jgi:hypothetical protein
MENITFSQMNQAIEEAEATIAKVDNYVSKMARIVTNRLHVLDDYQLKRLKSKLSKYNTKTGEWK